MVYDGDGDCYLPSYPCRTDDDRGETRLVQTDATGGHRDDLCEVSDADGEERDSDDTFEGDAESVKQNDTSRNVE